MLWGHEAVDALQEADNLRRRTREAMQGFWFPLIIFGGLTLASAPLSEFGTGEWQAIFWLLGAPLGSVFVARYYARRELRIGISARELPYVLTAVGLAAGAILTGVLGSPSIQLVGPPVVISVGILVFGWLERSPVLAPFAVGLAAFALSIELLKLPRAHVLETLAYGLTFLSLGLVMRWRRERS